MQEFEIAGVTHAGRRPSNEDRVVIDPACGLAVVADGMGGEHAGEVAAEASCRSIHEVVQRSAGDEPALHQALDAAAAHVLGLGRGAHEGMGSTIAAVRIVVAESLAEIGHVGDVRVYIVRRGSAANVPSAAPRYCPPITAPSGAIMVCATRDHSSVCELVERGHLDRHTAATHPLRSKISRALGRSDVRADLRVLPLLAGDRLVICTDGLWAALADTEIARIVDEQPGPQATCDALLQAALAAGASDNIGIAVVHWRGRVRSRSVVVTKAPPQPALAPVPVAPPPVPTGKPLPRNIAAYCRDITQLAREGRLDPVIGRDREVIELARTLLQRRNPNALLIGEPGVGKTSLVEALAQRIVSAGDGDDLARMQVVELSLTDLVAGTKLRGELEERIGDVIAAATADPDLVLFIDEMHALAAGGAADSPGATLANALKPALSRAGVRLIGATTIAEHARHLAPDEAFMRRFAIIQLAEPTTEQTRTMLRGLRPKLETHYRARIDDSAIDAAIELANRYMPDRRLPDKAIDLLDRACSRRMLSTLSGPRSTAPVLRRDVASAVADRCRLPLALVERDAAQVLAAVEAELRDRIKGQDTAIATITASLRRAHTPLRDPMRPLASFLLAGPTGVGKTATARAIAESLFGRDALIRIDMSELGERQSVSRLIGAPPGYVGHGDDGQLTGPLRRRPASVILLDEIEKAHPDILMLLLQILGDGTLTDARGRPASFREAIVIMTTNLPLAVHQAAPVGFGRARPATPDADERDDANRKALAKHLAPELVGRIDAVVPFRALEAADHEAIVDSVVGRLEGRLRAQGVMPPDGVDSRRRVLERLDALGFGVRQVERIAEQVVAEGLDREAAPPGANDIVHSSIRTRVHVAMLLVDIIGSTKLLEQAGETVYVGVVRRLVEAVRCHPTAADMQFLKCTGDGVLALYGNVDSALEAGAQLAEIDAGADRVPLRRVVHYGRVRQGPVGDFLGVEMHRVFRIEALASDARIDEGPPLPHTRLLVTAAARDRLDPHHRDRLRPAGTYRLTGFGEPIELWIYPRETP